jgi:endo-1,3-1,4-beta-glycanase ExoK
MTNHNDQKKSVGWSRREAAAVLILGLVSTVVLAPDVQGARRATRPPPAQDSFTDQLLVFDATRWMKADGWKNGSPFDNAWLADHITFVDGLMDIRLDDQTSLGEPYSSGNYQSLGFYGYGCYEASFRPVAEPGVVSSFFTFAGPYDNGGNGKHNEIDIEFLGYDTRAFQANFWTNDDAYAGRHETMIYLDFDASLDNHRYAFKWLSSGIEWYVDGTRVYTVVDTPADPTPKAEDSLQKIMMNVWPVDATAAGWAGSFVYPLHPLHGVYDWIRYTAGEDCAITDPPPSPPPTGDPSFMHAGDIALSLNKRGDQVITRVSVVNGMSEPVPGATVTGAWSGVITSGDGARTTDADGIATFYSGRSRTPGSVTFCIIGITGESMVYDKTANAETCDSINK